MRNKPLLTASILLLAACASVKTVSQRDPSTSPKVFRTVMVLAATSNLALQIRAESSFVRAATSSGSQLVPAHKVILSGRHYSEAEFLALLRHKGIDGVLALNDATTDAPTVTRSAQAIPLCTMTAGSTCVQGMTVVTGTQNVRQDRFTISARLFDVSGEPVWTASTRVQRNGATDNSLFDRLAREVLQTLTKDGLLERK